MKKDGFRLIKIYLVAFFAIIALFLLFSCTTTRNTEQEIDYRHMARITQKMDSMIHATSVWQQSLYEKQSSLVDSFKQSEVRDTSRIVFLGAKGDTIKEKIVIREYIEREHSSQESTQELKEEFFRQTDSLLSVNKTMEAKMDSLLREHNKDTVVEKKLGLMERLKWIGIGVLLSLIGAFAAITAYMKKK